MSHNDACCPATCRGTRPSRTFGEGKGEIRTEYPDQWCRRRGVGTLGIQILKSYGVKVTGVDSDEKLDLMKSLGYDSVMDYKKVDFTDTGEKYDLILDTKSNRSVFKYARSLKKNGTYITLEDRCTELLEIGLLGLADITFYR